MKTFSFVIRPINGRVPAEGEEAYVFRGNPSEKNEIRIEPCPGWEIIDVKVIEEDLTQPTV